MSRHLSPRDVVDALDGVLDAGRGRHLDNCAACQARLTEARETVERVEEQGDVPEPSPLFWEHLQARVRERTGEVPESGARWRAWGFRALAVGAPALVTVTLIVTLDRQTRMSLDTVPAPTAPDVAVLSEVPAVEPVDMAIWSEVAELAADVPVDQLQMAMPVRSGTAETWLEDFTLDQRAELVRLLKEAIGGGL